MRKCQAQNKDGSPCSAQPLAGRDWCHWHDPERAEIRDESRRKGGRASSKAARAKRLISSGLASLGGINELMKVALWDTYLGELDPAVFAAMATGVRAIKDLSIAAEYGEEVIALREELARLRAERSA